MEIKPIEEKLTPISMDWIFNAFAPAWNQKPGRRKKFVLDLGNIRFIDPYSEVCLCVLLKAISERIAAPPQIIPPESESVVHYLTMSGFWRHISAIADVCGDVNLESKPISLDSNVLLELTKIGTVADIKCITRRLIEIIDTNLGYSEKNKTEIISLISELCCNITDHSKGVGWVTAQNYCHHNNGKKFINIGVADGGVGIRDSLGSRFPEAAVWTHETAIVKALTKNFSSRPDRGLGLATVKKIVGEYKGHLHIRSGNYRAFLGSSPGGFSGAWFPGVQVSIQLSESAGS